MDANVRHEVFSVNRRTEAGTEFFKWINGDIRGKTLRLVIGGKLTEELIRDDKRILDWLAEAVSSAKVFVISDQKIKESEKIIDSVQLKSNDYHIITLALASGARLLYSKDKDLHTDFKSPDVIGNPRGSVYSTIKSGDLDDNKRRLLRRASEQCAKCSGK